MISVSALSVGSNSASFFIFVVMVVNGLFDIVDDMILFIILCVMCMGLISIGVSVYGMVFYNSFGTFGSNGSSVGYAF